MRVIVANGQTEKPIRFRVDRPLGKLLKWLRLLGFDALSDSITEKMSLATAIGCDDRIWITNTKLPAPIEGIIVVTTDHPIDQLRTVITALHIQRQSLKLFTRCSACNHELVRVARENIKGQVPDYIWETHRQFRTCDHCQKIFWPGSHVDKQRRIIDKLFE